MIGKTSKLIFNKCNIYIFYYYLLYILLFISSCNIEIRVLHEIRIMRLINLALRIELRNVITALFFGLNVRVQFFALIYAFTDIDI